MPAPTYLSTSEILKELGQDRCQINSDRKLSIGSHVIRCSGRRLVAVGGEEGEKKQISALLDALHWERHTFKDQGLLRFVVGGGKHTYHVLQAIATLLTAMVPKTRERIQIEVDFQPVELSCPNFADAGSGWLTAFRERESAKLPSLAVQIQSEVNEPGFRWYRTVTSKVWSGRIEGLEVCKIRPPYTQGVVTIGSPGKNGDLSKPRRRFLELSKNKVAVSFDENSRSNAVALIRDLVGDRRVGTLAQVDVEHLLEAQILRGDVTVNMADVGPLTPVTDIPFQFPTLWSMGGKAKYVDILMKAWEVPWLLELKIATGGGQGQYYRHAIGQAVLYRTFIRQAKVLHPWFQDHQLDPQRCQAAITFPEIRGPEEHRIRLLDHLTWLARLFDVAVVSLPAGHHLA